MKAYGKLRVTRWILEGLKEGCPVNHLRVGGDFVEEHVRDVLLPVSMLTYHPTTTHLNHLESRKILRPAARGQLLATKDQKGTHSGQIRSKIFSTSVPLKVPKSRPALFGSAAKLPCAASTEDHFPSNGGRGSVAASIRSERDIWLGPVFPGNIG